MGIVYRGEHLYLGKEVAIKILRAGPGPRERTIKWFLREARAAGRIDHPGIVKVTDFGKSADGAVFLVMELVRGEPLDAVLERERRLQPARAMSLVLEIADATAAAHREGIIHRDLKPANVMVRTRAKPLDRAATATFESIKLLDFGVARMHDPATGGWLEPDTIVGTAEYIAPEAVRGEAIDVRSDVYSLGVILYQALAGSVPFRGGSALDTMWKAAEEPFPPLRARAPDLELGPEVDALLARALAKRPQDRHPSVEDFMGELRRCRSRLAAHTGHPRLPAGDGAWDGLDGSWAIRSVA